MKTVNKNHIFSKLKLGARRSPECRNFHNLPQTPSRKGTAFREVQKTTQFQLLFLKCRIRSDIYKYWFKMLKRWKFPPLIKARASSTNCTMGNLTCSRHATYLHTIYVKSREIHILSTIQILDYMNEYNNTMECN